MVLIVEGLLVLAGLWALITVISGLESAGKSKAAGFLTLFLLYCMTVLAARPALADDLPAVRLPVVHVCLDDTYEGRGGDSYPEYYVVALAVTLPNGSKRPAIFIARTCQGA